MAVLLLVLIVFFATSTASMSQTCLQRLAGQRVLVTGGGRGIGQAIAILCGEEGAKVAISSRTPSELQETAAIMKEKGASDVFLSVTDVTDKEQVEAMVKSVVDKFGAIDVLVNNVGSSQRSKGPMETLDSDDLRSLFDLNVVSIHMVTSAVLRQTMLEHGGRIVNISSRAGKVGLPHYSFYCATKFALEGLTASLAEELREKGITVNTLSPGMVNTKSFPKVEGTKGVRTAESVKDGLFVLLESNETGHYLHVDELDQARDRGLEDCIALKPIREPLF